MSTYRDGIRDAAMAVESLRLTNPINGDASNYTLDKAIKALKRLDDEGASQGAKEAIAIAEEAALQDFLLIQKWNAEERTN